MADAKVDFHDADLRRQLTLTTADLRFADHLVKTITDERGDIFLDSTGTFCVLAAVDFFSQEH
jgi:hypothetical protein